jgi:Holliday junction resolvase RusA-like endonuclease
MNLVLPVPPSANRIWRRSGARTHKSAAYLAWQEAALWALREQVGTPAPIEGDAAVVIILVGRTGIDTDNVAKPTLDLLERAQVLVNDKQAMMIELRRRKTDEPARIEVTVTTMQGAPA